MSKNRKPRKVLKITLVSITVLILLLVSGFIIYTGDYYHSESQVDQTLTLLQEEGRVQQKENLTIIYPKEKSEIGFIFYPGGKVEETAYLPLLSKLSEQGITCVLVKMPFHLAVFGINSADKVYSLIPEVKKWYLSGHSLGGAMASSYAGEHEDKLKGLILLGAYPVNNSTLPSLTIYGSEDKVLNREKLTQAKSKVEVEGGNHAFYGNYGEQKGDGKATISREEQQDQCVQLIGDFIQNK